MDVTKQFGGAYAGRRVLVTGHTGFKGSWLVYWLRQLGAEVSGLALDPDTAPSHWQSLGMSLEQDARVDLQDIGAVRSVFSRVRPELVFHLGAQSLVKRGYGDPARTFSVNVLGLVNVLEATRTCSETKVLVNATTDKVYAITVPARAFTEADALGGRDPYSASKTCAEIVSASYASSYFAGTGGPAARLATARAGNVIGGGDWADDRLVPDLIRAATDRHPLAVRNPAAIRPWQHVLEPLSGYLALGHALLNGTSIGGAWNFGPKASDVMTVGEVVEKLQRFWPALKVSMDTRPHPYESDALLLECGKAARELGWRPVWDNDTALERTASWYAAFHDNGAVRTSLDLEAYVASARAAHMRWAE